MQGRRDGGCSLSRLQVRRQSTQREFDLDAVDCGQATAERSNNGGAGVLAPALQFDDDQLHLVEFETWERTARSGLFRGCGHGRRVVDHRAIASAVAGEAIGLGFEGDELGSQVF